jgi:CRISPR-associated exonuclease Cas4
MITVLALVLALAALVYLALGRLTHHERAKIGLDNGVLVAADDSRLGSPTLRSARLGLIGRPDHLLRSGNVLIPVEQKPSARRAYPSHMLQVAAECMLVQEVYGVRPPYGLLVLAGGVQERIQFTPALERRLLQAMAEMRALLNAGTEPGAIWVAPKCQACGFRDTCWE